MSEHIKIEDLIQDPSFLNWVSQSNENDQAKWNKWSQGNPDRVKLLHDAKALVDGFSFKIKSIDEQQVNDSWGTLASKINDKPSEIGSVTPLYKTIMKMAAAILVLGVAIWGVSRSMNDPTAEMIVFESGTDTSETFELPDGSKLTLNTNSKVELNADFLNRDRRLVQLEGEGYFEVTKQTHGKIFLVHAKDVTVEVTGTAFNVNSKRETPIVSLIEGGINLIKSNLNKTSLVAGQTAWFDDSKNMFEVVDDQTDYWKSWTDNKWSFGTGTSMSEILDRIQETYGLKCAVKDSSILQKKASGELSVETKEVLFEALSTLLDVNLIEENGQLIVTSMNE